MAVNLVKWWKHKILGGYKQFSECTTDSEELMYHQVRASSSCSAPPDLLPVSDRENNVPARSPGVNLNGSTTAPATTTTSPLSGLNACHITSANPNNNQRHNLKLQHKQQHRHNDTVQQLSQLPNSGTKDTTGNGSKHQKHTTTGNGSKHGHQQQDCQQQTQPHDEKGQIDGQTNNHSSTRQAHQTQQNLNEHICLEEFTCDVSVEGGKSSEPLQFSFTFYDLDCHHGKITKDDIVGIVYTIYESIGKSVVVPNNGSKTINVRLSVSTESKSKTEKNVKASSSAVVLESTQKTVPLVSQAARRLHRYRIRKLIKSYEEDDDSNSGKERHNSAAANTPSMPHILWDKSSGKNHKLNKLKTEQHQYSPTTTELANSPLETIYDNLKVATSASTPEACRECLAAVNEYRNAAAISPITQYPAAKTSSAINEAYIKHMASTRSKMLRKSRKQKHQDCMETRQRSLSVGNESCWKNRHLQKQSIQQQLPFRTEQQLNQSSGGGVDMIDGVQLRNPLKGSRKSSTSDQKRNSAECWNTALNRNDLIGIIRESMEKNRLCFQLNGKPQANVSPIRHLQPSQQQHIQQQQQHNNSNNSKHTQQKLTTPTNSQRQRSNTVSKIPTLIAKHNSPHQSYYAGAHHRSSSCVNTTNNNQYDTSLYESHNNSNSSNNMYHHHHLQPHIPIYHQQMAINPAVIAAQNALLNASNGGASAAGHHGKMNLCGYDSFLHATICGGGLSHSPPPHHTSLNTQVTPTTAAGSGYQGQQQQIATVQPIMSTSRQNTPKHLSLALSANHIKTSKILQSGSYAQTQHQYHSQVHTSNTNQNSPQYHGYQRLPSSSKHNLSALHLVSPTMEKPPLDQLNKWRRDQVKKYDQLLYAKLSEKLQQTNLVSSSSAVHNARRKHRVLRQRRANNIIAEANNVSLSSQLVANKVCLRDDSDYAATMPLGGDPVECENLLGQTTDEESHSQHDSPLHSGEEKLNAITTATRCVAEDTLVNLNDVEGDDDNGLAQDHGLSKHSLNADTLLGGVEAELEELHLNDGLEIEEDLDDELDTGVNVAESGRNSAVSNDSNNAGATLANTSGGANTSTTSSSLIHRYVHEHIHHHYHHFEEKEE